MNYEELEQMSPLYRQHLGYDQTYIAQTLAKANTDPDVCYRLCQHSGNWGPWYHISRYRRAANGGWIYAKHIGGHYSLARARKTGLEFGRPD